MTFNEDKTRIVHLDDGFDFLGFTARRRNGKLIIKPSKTAVKRVRKRLAVEFRALRGTNPATVLAKINPIVRGWTNYYQGAASSIVFAALDVHLWRLAYKWACHHHPHKPKHWIINRYFGRYNTARQDRWVFGDRTSGAYLPKFAWTKIVRHSLVRGDASPDDPAQADYWANRRAKSKPPLDRRTLHLLRRQHGSCPICGQLLLHADREPQSPHEWEKWHRTTRRAINKQILVVHGPGLPDETRLVHSSCHRRTTGARQEPAPLYS